MPRRPNTRPTAIYWLVDVRPATLATWPNGLPFYCGKTVASLSRRFSAHRREARNGAARPLHDRLRLCGDYVRTLLVELVPVGADWCAREQHWIAILRASFPGCVNVANGGAGPAGFVHSETTRARFSELGRAMSAETRAKIGAAHRGRKQTAEWKANRAAAQLGKRRSPEQRATMKAAQQNRPPVSDETRAKLSATSRGRKQSAEQIEKSAAARRGQKYSPETLDRMRVAAIARCARLGNRSENGQFVSLT